MAMRRGEPEPMKHPLVILNVLSVAVYGLWLGYHALKALGSAFGNANPATGPGDVAYVFIVIGIATVACVVASVFAPTGSSGVIAVIPVALVLAGQGFITYQVTSNRQRYSAEEVVKKAARESKLAQISKDYALRETDQDTLLIRESFLTHDREMGTIVRIDVDFGAQLSAFCVGKVHGDRLELFEDGDAWEKHYRRYLNAEGESIFDRYEARYKPGQDYRDYHLERFEP